MLVHEGATPASKKKSSRPHPKKTKKRRNFREITEDEARSMTADQLRRYNRQVGSENLRREQTLRSNLTAGQNVNLLTRGFTSQRDLDSYNRFVDDQIAEDRRRRAHQRLASLQGGALGNLVNPIRPRNVLGELGDRTSRSEIIQSGRNLSPLITPREWQNPADYEIPTPGATRPKLSLQDFLSGGGIKNSRIDPLRARRLSDLDRAVRPSGAALDTLINRPSRENFFGGIKGTLEDYRGGRVTDLIREGPGAIRDYRGIEPFRDPIGKLGSGLGAIQRNVSVPTPVPYLFPGRSGDYTNDLGKWADERAEAFTKLSARAASAADKATGGWIDPVNAAASDIEGQEGTTAYIVDKIRNNQDIPEEAKENIPKRFLKPVSRKQALLKAKRNGVDVDEHSHDMDIIYGAYASNQTGFGGFINSVAKDAAAITFGAPAGIYGALGAASRGVRGEGGLLEYGKESFVDPYVSLSTDPNFARQHPLMAALMLTPIGKGVGVGLGRTVLKPGVRPDIEDRTALPGITIPKTGPDDRSITRSVDAEKVPTIQRGEYAVNVLARPLQRLNDAILASEGTAGTKLRARHFKKVTRKNTAYGAARAKAIAATEVAEVTEQLAKMNPDQQKKAIWNLNTANDMMFYAKSRIDQARDEIEETGTTDINWERWQEVQEEFTKAGAEVLKAKDLVAFRKATSALQAKHDKIREEMGMFDTGALRKQPNPNLHNVDEFDVLADIEDPKENAKNLAKETWVHHTPVAEALTRGEYPMGVMADRSLGGPGAYFSNIGQTPYAGMSRALNRAEIDPEQVKSVVDLETNLDDEYVQVLQDALDETVKTMKEKFGEEEVDKILNDKVRLFTQDIKLPGETKPVGGVARYLVTDQPKIRAKYGDPDDPPLPWWAYHHRAKDHRTSKYQAYRAVGRKLNGDSFDNQLPDIMRNEWQREVQRQLIKRGHQGVSHEGGYSSGDRSRYQVLVLFDEDTIGGLKSSVADPRVGSYGDNAFPFLDTTQKELKALKDQLAVRREMEGKGYDIFPALNDLRNEKRRDQQREVMKSIHGEFNTDPYFDTYDEMVEFIDKKQGFIEDLEQEKMHDPGWRDDAALLQARIELYELERRKERADSILNTRINEDDLWASAVNRSISESYEAMHAADRRIGGLNEEIAALERLLDGDDDPNISADLGNRTMELIGGKWSGGDWIDEDVMMPREFTYDKSKIKTAIAALQEELIGHQEAYWLSNPLAAIRLPIRPAVKPDSALNAKVEKALSIDPLKNSAKWMKLTDIDQLRSGNFDTSTSFFVDGLKAPFLIQEMTKVIENALDAVTIELPKSGKFKVDYSKGLVAFRIKPSTRNTEVKEGEWSDTEVAESLYNNIEVHPMPLGEEGGKVVPTSQVVDGAEGWKVARREDIDMVARAIKNTEPKVPGNKFYKASDFWRYQALNLRIGYLVNNILGNVILAVQSGASARDFIKASYKLSGDRYNKYVPVELTHAGYNINEVGHLADAFKDSLAGKVVTVPGNFIMNKNIAFENFARRAAYIGEARRRSSREIRAEGEVITARPMYEKMLALKAERDEIMNDPHIYDNRPARQRAGAIDGEIRKINRELHELGFDRLSQWDDEGHIDTIITGRSEPTSSAKAKALFRRATHINDEMDQFMARIAHSDVNDKERREIVDKVNDFMGDFVSNPYSYKAFMVVPFYRWLGHMVKLQMVVGPTKYPGRFVGMALMGMQGLEQMEKAGTSLRPDTLGALAIGGRTQGKYGNESQLVSRTAGWWPQATVGSTIAPQFRDPLEGLGAGILNQGNPLAKYLADIYLNRDISKPAGEDAFRDAEGKPIAHEDWANRGLVAVNRLWSLAPVLNQLASAQRGARDTNVPYIHPAKKKQKGRKATQWPTPPEDYLAQLLSFLGVPKYEHIPTAGPAAEKRLKTIRSILQDNG